MEPNNQNDNREDLERFRPETPKQSQSSLKVSRQLRGLRFFGALFLASFVLIICILVARMAHGPLKWWEYGDCFCIFMAAFCALVGNLFGSKLVVVGRRLNLAALLFFVAGMVWLGVNYFVMQ